MPQSPADGAPDETLAARAAAGEDPAFEELLARYEARAYRLAVRLTGSAADAQDVVQEAFLSAYRGLAAFRGEAGFSTWLFRIVTNAALMQRRGRKRRPTTSLDDGLPRFDGDGRHAAEPADLEAAVRVEERLDRETLAAHAQRAVDALPEPYRVAFVLRDLEEMETSEVAALLGIGTAAVRQRVHRARLLLRGYLSGLVGVGT
jgi:RNA polymerase sigma-70 factor (ECF subfamily)